MDFLKKPNLVSHYSLKLQSEGKTSLPFIGTSMQSFLTLKLNYDYKELTALEVLCFKHVSSAAPSSTHPQEFENSSQIVETASLIIDQIQGLTRKSPGTVRARIPLIGGMMME